MSGKRAAGRKITYDIRTSSYLTRDIRHNSLDTLKFLQHINTIQ